MIGRSMILVPSLATVAMFALPIAAQAPRAHQCVDCHSTHAAPGPTLLKEVDVEVLCLSCHGPGGIAPEAAVHTNKPGSTHAAFSISCITCHTPHSSLGNWLGGTNIKQIGRSLDTTYFARINTPSSGIADVVFESRGSDASEPTLHSFADNDEDNNGIWDGVCEVCHTQTSYHRNSVPDSGHNIGRTCTDCHPHTDNFNAAGGGCTDCHNSVKGTGSHVAGTLRRAIVGPNGDFQNSIGGHFAGTDPTNFQCIVCHAEGYYDAGAGEVRTDPAYHNASAAPFSGTPYTVDLRNVDSASGVFPVRTDPTSWPVSLAPNGTYGSPTNVYKNNLTQFCLGCHDGDGATASFSVDPTALGSATDPFGIGQTPMDLVAKFDTSNFSTHNLNSLRTGSPVTASMLAGSFTNGWAPSSITECADCHLGEDPAATPTYYHNAHGGRNLRWLLADMNGLDQADTETNENLNATTVCFRCHYNEVYCYDGSLIDTFSRYPEHAKSAHMNRAENVFGIACLSCHGGYELPGGGIHGTDATIVDDHNNGNGSYPAIRFTNGAALDYFGPGEGRRGATLCSVQGTATGNNLGCTNHSSNNYTPNY